MQNPHWTAPASTNASCTRMELVRRREPLDRGDVVAVGLRREHEARADEHAVEQHRARPALALLAGVLRPREAELLAQCKEQRLPLPAVGLGLDAVDAQLDPQLPASSRARGVVITRSACRRYAAVPRTSSIGEAAAATSSGNDSASSRGAVTTTGRGDADPNEARSSSPADTASETTAITIALRGPIFMNVCGARDGVSQTAVISSSAASALRFTPVTNSESGIRREPRTDDALDLRVLDHERRERVAGRRGGGEVAADRAAVADLRRADGARGLGKRRQQLGQLAAIASV